MRPSARSRFACLTAITLLAGLSLTACAGDDEGTGSPFTQALATDYADLGAQAAALPLPPDDGGLLDSLDVFGLFASNPNDSLSSAFSAKADIASSGQEPDPEAAPGDTASQAIRARLIRDLAAGKNGFPTQAARAQADYDCWVMASGVPTAGALAQSCRSALEGSLNTLEAAARPAPTPPPVYQAPIAAPAPPPPPPPSDYTVYFDFDSWTLTAENLKVLTDVIESARTGGQAHITVVGHTDTSGAGDYNQRLSVRRANVVVEALVTMGARRQAITASGVGENDLAVATGDDVKEAKNRRSVIGLQP